MAGLHLLIQGAMPITHCDIFCKVIDNYGDIGVCWRLARQLVAEHGLAVRLWVDELASFRLLAPALDPALAVQDLAGIAVRRWDASADAAEPPELVIEAFGCGLPEGYLAAMARRAVKPAWLNLEYLSAEAWVEGCHGLPSPHPRLPLTCHFFFPGFTEKTGGLLREAALLGDLQAFQADSRAQRDFWEGLLGKPLPEGVLKVSLFAYENPAIPRLLDAWAGGAQDIFCAVTAGRHVPQVRAWLGSVGAATGSENPLRGQCPLLHVGRLTLAFLPFLSQPDYDRLLAACDLNFVRGEDSCVRAQWAARPFVWHIYQQAEDAHRPKLAAFLDRYAAGLGAPERAALADFWHAWERGEAVAQAWLALAEALPALRSHAEGWVQKLVTQADLVSNMLIFSKNLLECRA